MKLKCGYQCKKYYKFVQQIGWSHHFLPLCGCRENRYIVIPNYINKSQYHKYMEAVTVKENIVEFHTE